MYWVPGGRIGLMLPENIAPWANSWEFLSPDHTMRVAVYEQMRLGASADAHLWVKDRRSRKIEPNLALPGLELRRFIDLRYGDSPDYSAESIVLRDADWIGQVEVDIGNVTGRGGLNARWAQAKALILSSIAVREARPLDAALGELGIAVDTTGLNPRLSGYKLILSPAVPRTRSEAWGVGISHVLMTGLSILPPGARGDDAAKFQDEMFAIYSNVPSMTVIQGAHCRGVRMKELQFIDAPPMFSTRVEAYSRTRHQEITALYYPQDRDRMQAAVHQLFQSLKLTEL